MPKVSVYLPQHLYRRAIEAGLPLSRVCQVAVADAVADAGVEGESTTAQAIRRAVRQLEVLADQVEMRENVSGHVVSL